MILIIRFTNDRDRQKLITFKNIWLGHPLDNTIWAMGKTVKKVKYV